MTDKQRADLMKLISGVESKTDNKQKQNKPTENADFRNYFTEVSEMMRIGVDEFINKGFDREEAIDITLTLIQTLMMGGRQE